MRVSEFDFELPEELIALRPVEPRDAARLLHVDTSIKDKVFKDIIDLLNSDDVLVMNNTKVIPAALIGERAPREVGGGGAVKIEFNLHKALKVERNKAAKWRAFARPAKRLRAGDVITFADDLFAKVMWREEAEVEMEFSCTALELNHKLEQVGEIPLPPYIGRKRAIDEKDAQDYQTVFAKTKGSVAAPTAGLHFTPEILQALRDKYISIQEVTLHVGAGTFLPVSVEDTKLHKMHAEWGEISKETATAINEAKRGGGRVICVGTTSLRLLESAATEEGRVEPFTNETDIFITPGYNFKIVDCLLTNFHLPKSTLFMLVSAFLGLEKMKAAYQHAIDHKYRFYSYGDACLLERHG